MYMSYTNNPNMPKVRGQAVRMIRAGYSTREVAKHFGYTQSTIVKWVKRAPHDRLAIIPTASSKPHTHPKALAKEVVGQIITTRLKHHRCAQVVHKELLLQGCCVSLSSVKRTLQRSQLLKTRSPWKKWHITQPRPKPTKPGILCQIDTVHFVPLLHEKFYVYTFIDIYSRWAYAKVVDRINTHHSIQFVREVIEHAPFTIEMIQTDHGQEFSTHFTQILKHRQIQHRHSRVRKPDDNAHIERFNRTLKEECLSKLPKRTKDFKKALLSYLPYYNAERLHMGIDFKTPLQVIPRS